MTQTVCILGRQPALGLAELESLFGAEHVQPIGSVAALLDIDPPQIDFSRLGGTVKFCKLLTILETTNWEMVQEFLEKSVPEHIGYLPEGKMKLGLSVYGLEVSVKRLNASGLELKKVIRASGRSVRIIPNVEKFLNSAQVLHNKLTSALGWELIFIRDGNRTIVAQNIAEQDIEAYARRDQGRPKRDSQVGMLPPKLAQIIINLAAGLTEPIDPTCGPVKDNGLNLLDPFCGTGVLVQEALFMGYRAFGADKDLRMGEYYSTNMDWLTTNYPELRRGGWELADATKDTWHMSEITSKPLDAKRVPLKIDLVASETYLGRPFSAAPAAAVLSSTIQDVNTILKKFLQNLAKQTAPGLRACLALPAWKVAGGFKHLPILDQLTDMGYTRVSFKSVLDKDLIYHREGQVVGRELVTLVRK